MFPIYTKHNTIAINVIWLQQICAVWFYGARLRTCDPVDSDALHTSDSIGHYILSPRLVSLGSANSAQAHINPVDGVVLYRDINLITLKICLYFVMDILFKTYEQ